MTALAVGAVAAGAAVYAAGTLRLWREAGSGRIVTHSNVLSGVGAVAAVALALAPPVDAIAHRLLTAHMVQHLALIIPAAVLAANARIGTALLGALPATARRRLRRSQLPSGRRLRATASGLALWMVHVTVVLAWHVPTAYDGALGHAVTHAVEHATMAATAVALWWHVLRSRRYGAGAVYATVTAAAGSVLGALMVFSSHAWYQTYEATALAWGTTALADQQVAGAVMWVGGVVGYLGVALAFVIRWLRRAERRADTHGRRQAASLVTWALVFGIGLVVAACGRGDVAEDDDEAVARGRAAVVEYGCIGCHQIPDVAAPQGNVGPSLDGFANRRSVAGRLPNTPPNVAAWVRDPQAIDPGNVMPTLGVTEDDADAIAAFLSQLD